MAYGFGNVPHAAAPAHSPVVKAAAQRFLNKASGKMETRQAMSQYRRPAAQHTNTSSHTSTRTTTQTRQPPSLIQMSPKEIEARAAAIVNNEVAAERLPFQQRQGALTGEQAGVTAAHQQNYAKLDTSTAGLQTQQREGAKTYQNQAAEMVKKAGESGPTAQETQERLGGAPAPGSAAQRQQEASRTLLSAIAQGAQAGTNARQQAEESFLTNIRASGQQEGAAGTTQIASDYGKRKQEVGNQEGQVVAGKPGRIGKLSQGLLGEQEKLRIAAGALGNQEKKTEISAFSAKNTAKNQGATQNLNREKLNQSANEGALNREQRENASKRTAASASKARTQKLNEKHEKATGKKPTKEQTQVTKELADTFTAFETIVRNRTLGHGGGKKAEQVAYVRQHLPKGKAGELAASNPWAIRAGEELWYTHKVSKATRDALGRLGLNIGYDPQIFKAVSGK